MLVDHVTVTFEHQSGQPRDRVVNTFTWASEVNMVNADMDALTTSLESFYNSLHGVQTQTISSFMSGALSRTVKPTVRHYDLDGHLGGTPAGSPVRTTQWAANLGAGGSATNLPAEVAVCLSFAAAFGSDVEFAPGTRPRARDRGRIFIGPLNVGAIAAASPGRVIPVNTLQIALIESARFLKTNPSVGDWAIWSRKQAAVKIVDNFWVDDAMDTQRRRGERPLARLSGS